MGNQMKTIITSDSTCDLSPALIQKYHIELLPITITMGLTCGRDGIDVTPDDIYSYVALTDRIPQTCAANISEYEEFFRKYDDPDCNVIHFNLGSGISSTHQNARLAAEERDNVFVVDSENLSSGQGLLVLKAAEMAQECYAPEQIVEECRKMAAKIETSFVIDSLDYLFKGGRCSALKLAGANILRIKPCIEVKDGIMVPGKNYKGTMKRALRHYVEDRLKDRDDIDKHRIFVTHTRCDSETIQLVIKTIREIVPDFEEVLETTAGATVTTHCGPNTLGLMFARK